MTEESVKLFPDEPSQNEWRDTDWCEWERAASSLRQQDSTVTAFETKVLYTFGMMRHMLEASGWTLEHDCYCKDKKDPNPLPFYFSAYLLACGAVELMGCCVLEESEHQAKFQRALKRGLERMIEVCPHCHGSNIHGEYSGSSWQSDEEHVVVSIDRSCYTIGDCRRFRNFMAHGTADPKGELRFTPEFVAQFICQACRGIDRYYEALRTPGGKELRKRLAKAAVVPIWDNTGPLHVHHLYEPLMCSSSATPCGELLHESKWRVRCSE